jgi:hypothetical protein
MYENNMSNEEFLKFYYTKALVKLKDLERLNHSPKNIENELKITKIKNNLNEFFTILNLGTNSDFLKDIYNSFKIKLTLNKDEDLDFIITFLKKAIYN